jgi:hypothetical protein
MSHTYRLWPEGYTVDMYGNVYSQRNWRGYGLRLLDQTPNSDGYASVRLSYPDGSRKRHTVHSMVAAAYLPPCPSCDHEIRHLDGDKTNNAATNLAWGTKKENADDRERHGRTSRGFMHGLAIRSGLEASHV